MDTAGEDLKRYLIIPHSPSSSSPPSSSPAASNSENPTFSAHHGTDTIYEHTPGSCNKAEKHKMGGDTPTQPPPTAVWGAQAEEMDKSTPLAGVFKMDDFLNQHKDAHQAQMLARETKQAAATTPAPPSKNPKTNENTVPLMPVAVGARSSRHTILLHEKYQALGIPQPQFTYGGGGETGWTVSVSFPGLDDAEELQGLSVERKFNSKQEAKEAVSQKAFAVLEELEREGRVQKGGGKSKKKEMNADEMVVQQEKGPVENYVGQLLEFQRATASPQPTYTDYQSGQRFACLVTIEGEDKPFGSIESLFTSKKAARQDAARHAVEHFKAMGTWPDDATSVGGIKKKKLMKAQAQAPDPEIVPISTPPRTRSTTSPSPFSSPTTTSSPSTGTTSYAQQVAALAVTLALPTPEWHYTSHPSDPAFHTVSCFFRGAGPHEGPLGEARNVYGKKKAKEECARLTLQYLNEVREKRVQYGREMMSGVRGAEGVMLAAAGRGVEGEGMGMGMGMGKDGGAGGDMGMDGVHERDEEEAKTQLDTEMGDSSDENEVFADAMEG